MSTIRNRSVQTCSLACSGRGPARVGRSRTDSEQTASVLRRALVAVIGDHAKGFVPIWLCQLQERYIDIARLFGMGAVFGL